MFHVVHVCSNIFVRPSLQSEFLFVCERSGGCSWLADINPPGFPAVRENLGKGLFLKEVRENLERSGNFFSRIN